MSAETTEAGGKRVWALAAGALGLHAVSRPALGGVLGRAGISDLALLFALAAAGLASRGRIERASLGWLACVSLLAVSVPLVGAPRTSLLQLAVLVYVGLLFALGREMGRRAVGELALFAFVLGCAACGLAGIVGVVGESLFSESLGWAARYAFIITSPRATGPTAGPAMLGAAMSCGLVGLSVLARRGVVRGAPMVVLGVTMGLASTLTQSRAILDLAASAGLAVALWSPSRTRVALGLALGASAAIVLGLTLVFRFSPFALDPPFIDLHPSLYAMCHDIGLRMFGDHPWTGVGLERFGAHWFEHFDAMRYARHLDGLGVGARIGPLDPHSTYLGFLAESGVVALPVLAAFAFSAARLHRRGTPELTCLLAFAALAALHMDVLTNRALALSIGILAGLEAQHRARASTSSRSSAEPSAQPMASS